MPDTATSIRPPRAGGQGSTVPAASAVAAALAGALDAGWAGAGLAALTGWLAGCGLAIPDLLLRPSRRARAAIWAIHLALALGLEFGTDMGPQLSHRVRSVLVTWPGLTLALWALVPPARLGTASLRGWALAVVAVACAGALGVQRSPSIATRVTGDSLLGGAPVLVLRALADRDADGHSAWLGGRDCDDADAAVHPGAFDKPGDGLDSDCSGRDATGLPLPSPVPTSMATPWPGPRPESAVLVTIDALRADRLPPDAASGPMPALQAFAAHALRAQRAYAPSSSTEGSLPALLAGGALATALAGAGRVTAGYVNGWTHANVPSAGRGFATYEPHLREPTEAQRRAMAPHTTARAMAFLDARAADDAPFLLWLHYIDAHSPYTPPGPAAAARPDQERYDAELAWLDTQLAPLLERLGGPELEGRVATVVTADHGEELLEHGGRFHATELYEESVRVPLLLRAPGVPPGVLRGTASLHDVPATLLDLLGVAAPPGAIKGASLLPHVDGTPLPRRPLVLEVRPRRRGPRRAIVWWPYKWMERAPEGDARLFNLVADPGETTNVAPEHPDIAELLRATVAERQKSR